jgi:hypothetical protein
MNIFIEKTDFETEFSSILNLLKNKTGLDWNKIFDKNYVIKNGFNCFDNIYKVRLEKIEH